MVSRRFTAILMTPLVLAVAGWVGVPAAQAVANPAMATESPVQGDDVPQHVRDWFAQLTPQTIRGASALQSDDPVGRIDDPAFSAPMATYSLQTGRYDLDTGHYAPPTDLTVQLDDWYCAYIIDGSTPTTIKACASVPEGASAEGAIEAGLNFMEDQFIVAGHDLDPAKAPSTVTYWEAIVFIANGSYALNHGPNGGSPELVALDHQGATILGASSGYLTDAVKEASRDQAELAILHNGETVDGMPGPLLERTPEQIAERDQQVRDALSATHTRNSLTKAALAAGIVIVCVIGAVIIAPKLRRNQRGNSRKTP